MIRISATQRLSAGASALVVHGALLVALVFGVSWKTLPHVPIQADLWAALPLPPAPVEVEEMIETPPAPVLEPKVETQAEPEAPPVPKPDIALKQAEERKRKAEEARKAEAARKAEEARRQEEVRKQAALEAERKLEEARKQEAIRQAEVAKKAEAEKKAEAQRQAEAQKQAELEKLAEVRRLEEQRKAAEAKRLADARLKEELDRAMRQQMAADLAQERRNLAEARAQAAATAARDKTIQDYQGRIGAKIRGLLRLPANLQGNPEAEFQVKLLANGEVIRVTLLKSSGQPAYDEEVERAILKASPLPLPPDRETAAVFRDNLRLKFRPLEG